MIFEFNMYKAGEIAYAISGLDDNFIIGFIVSDDTVRGIPRLCRSEVYPFEHDARSDLISWVFFYKNYVTEEVFGPEDSCELSNAVVVVKDKPIDIRDYRYVHYDEVKP